VGVRLGPPTRRNRSHRGHRSTTNATPRDVELNALTRVSPVFQTSGDTTGDVTPTVTKAPEALLWMSISGSHPLQGWLLVDVIGNVGPSRHRRDSVLTRAASPNAACFCTHSAGPLASSPSQIGAPGRFSRTAPESRRFRACSTGRRCAVCPFCSLRAPGSSLTSPTENRHG
jgi:hypothetical protein